VNRQQEIDHDQEDHHRRDRRFHHRRRGPGLAGDQNVNTLLRDSGRYVSQVNEPATHYTSHARAPEVMAQTPDFQLQGR